MTLSFFCGRMKYHTYLFCACPSLRNSQTKYAVIKQIIIVQCIMSCITLQSAVHYVFTVLYTTVVHLFDALTGKEIEDGQPLVHHNDITSVSLSQAGPTHGRLLALLDKNNDIYISSIHGSRDLFPLGKSGIKTSSTFALSGIVMLLEVSLCCRSSRSCITIITFKSINLILNMT